MLFIYRVTAVFGPAAILMIEARNHHSCKDPEAEAFRLGLILQLFKAVLSMQHCFKEKCPDQPCLDELVVVICVRSDVRVLPGLSTLVVGLGFRKFTVKHGIMFVSCRMDLAHCA